MPSIANGAGAVTTKTTPPAGAPRPPTRPFNGLVLAAIAMTAIFVIMIVSGLVLYVAPSGRIARTVDWRALGLDRPGWEAAHIAFAAMFVIVGVYHLTLNRKALGQFLVDRVRHTFTMRIELVLALGATALLLALAVLDWPPVSWLTDANRYFKQQFWDPGDLPPGAGEGRGAEGGQGRGGGRER